MGWTCCRSCSCVEVRVCGQSRKATAGINLNFPRGLRLLELYRSRPHRGTALLCGGVGSGFCARPNTEPRAKARVTITLSKSASVDNCSTGEIRRSIYSTTVDRIRGGGFENAKLQHHQCVCCVYCSAFISKQETHTCIKPVAV